MAKDTSKKGGFGAAVKEGFRKFIVSLKRKPQMIPFVVFIIAFLVYSLNLSVVSNTTAKLQGPGMGLCGFATMLFSILSLVCFLNAFPHRKPVNVPMLVLMFLMLAVIIFCDYYYIQRIYAAVLRPDNPIKVDANTMYIAHALTNLQAHMVVLGVGIVLTALLPVYSKLIRKIKTSVDVEDNGKLDTIDISGEA
ncbi:MAG: hypothetical protein II794_08765 [Oscillospiraceae bacterium]|nr:hypothetical protein [Oscillospiraceae bacterium]